MFRDLGGPGHLLGLERVVERASQRGVQPGGQRSRVIADRIDGAGEHDGVVVTLGRGAGLHPGLVQADRGASRDLRLAELAGGRERVAVSGRGVREVAGEAAGVGHL